MQDSYMKVVASVDMGFVCICVLVRQQLVHVLLMLRNKGCSGDADTLVIDFDGAQIDEVPILDAFEALQGFAKASDGLLAGLVLQQQVAQGQSFPYAAAQHLLVCLDAIYIVGKC